MQIHAAHFFFLSRFVSPAANRRADAWGGSTAGRARILLDVLAAIRAAAPSLDVWVKLNGSDFTSGGIEPPEALEIARLLAGAGIDASRCISCNRCYSTPGHRCVFRG